MLLAEAQPETLVGHRETKPLPLAVAIRVFPALKRAESKSRKNKVWRLPRAMFVFDTETRTDSSQRLTFGSYRFFVDNELSEEALFYADDLPSKDRRTLEKYVASQNKRGRRLLLVTRSEFLKKLYKTVYKGRALLVGFICRLTFPELPSLHVQREEGLRVVSPWLFGRI